MAGFEIWQVKAGTIFDNLLLTDDPAEAEAVRKATWEKNKDAEKEMKEKRDEEKRKADEAAAEAAEGDEDDEDVEEEELDEGDMKDEV